MVETTEKQRVDEEIVQEAPAPQLPAIHKPSMDAGADIVAIIPRSLEEAWRLAGAILDAGMAPDSYAKERGQQLPDKQVKARLMIGIMKSMEVGFAPITGINTICLINNRPSIYGAGAKALIQQSGKLEWLKEWFTGAEDKEDWTAHCEMKRVGQTEPYRWSFSVKDAKRARLWGNTKKEPWMLYPKDMLMVRAFSRCADKGFADCLAGLSIAEVQRDLAEAPAPIDTHFLDDAPAAPQIEHKPDALDEINQDATAAEPPYEPPPVDDTPPSDWPALADDLIGTVNAITRGNVDEINAWLGANESVATLKTAAPDQYARVLAAANVRAKGKR